MGMGSGRRKVGARHEPDFDAEPDFDPAVNAEDGASDAAEPRRRAPRAQAEPAAVSDDGAAPQRPRPSDPPASRRRRKRGGRGGGRSRSRVSRLLYWTLVLGLWAVIAAVGTVVWVGSTLPPIQSLEVPKRPPKIEIVGLDGRI